jgi:hypothetical protein
VVEASVRKTEGGERQRRREGKDKDGGRGKRKTEGGERERRREGKEEDGERGKGSFFVEP